MTPLYKQSPEDRRFYASAIWRNLAADMKLEEPVCRICQLRPAVQVHHIKDRKHYPALAFERTNLCPICIQCHSKITRQENILTGKDVKCAGKMKG